MAEDQYSQYAKMLDLLGNGLEIAEKLAEGGSNPIQIEDWNDQIKMINTAIDSGNPELTTRGNALLARLEKLKPVS
ncbi:MAG: hypothetical protein GY794_05050 [bacterium]|nr:hypothetical protein [bacterium]